MSQSSDDIHGESSFHSRWASVAIRKQFAFIQKRIPDLPNNLGRNELIPLASNSLWDSKHDNDPVFENPTLKVAIIGAGCAGLFTALIFDHLKEKCGLEVEYEILESNSEKRLGGRLYTHYFTEDKDARNHQYYDVGAMRFPEIETMRRTFDLFKELGMKKETGKNPQKGDLIPYYLEGKNTPLLFNDVQFVQPDKNNPPTGATFRIDGVPEPYLSTKPQDLVTKQIEHFTKRILENPKAGWDYLMKVGDPYSVRQWFQKEYGYNTIEWLETFNYGNRWYDQALSEMILEDLDFNHDKPWWCIEGGSQQAAYRMREKIKNTKSISFGKTVMAMSLYKDDMYHEGVNLTIKGDNQPHRYSAVFNSAPLGSMQRMNLTGLNLNWGTKQAIRSLGYGASCKIGIRFKNLWWIKEGIRGGVARTDLPLRVCVYPSYNLDSSVDPIEKPGVLLCSYTWSQEAQRMATLINSKSPDLQPLLIDNLARLHSKTNDQEDYTRMHKIISDAYDTHHAYDWYADPGTTGAFAYFGPSQFRNMYPWIVETDGRHIIIGEAASSHHAWVVGALESAVRGVYQFLYKKSLVSNKAHVALQMYNDGAVQSPYGPLPYEYDRDKDVKHIDPDRPRPQAEGEWARQQVLIEMLRLEKGVEMLDWEKVSKAEIANLIPATA